jgi:hypothetical protein
VSKYQFLKVLFSKIPAAFSLNYIPRELKIGNTKKLFKYFIYMVLWILETRIILILIQKIRRNTKNLRRIVSPDEAIYYYKRFD